MKPLRVLTVLCVLQLLSFSVHAQYSYVYLSHGTVGAVSKRVVNNNVRLNQFTIGNFSSDTVYTLAYDYIQTGTVTAVPTYTTNPTNIYQIYPHSEVNVPCINSPSTKNINTYVYGLYIRNVLRGVTTNTVSPALYSIINSTVTPTSPPFIRIEY